MKILLQIIGWLIFTGGLAFVEFLILALAFDGSEGEVILGLIAMILIFVFWVWGSGKIFSRGGKKESTKL